MKRRIGPEVTSHIAERFRGIDRDDLGLVFGSRSDAEIGATVERVARAYLAEAAGRVLFIEKSVGCVIGLELASGLRCVLKVFSPTHGDVELAAMQACLEAVVVGGFPAPAPISPLFRFDPGWAGLYAYRTGEWADARVPSVRRELAATLAWLARLVEPLGTTGLPVAPTSSEALWPRSHRSFLEIDDDDPGARWVDAIGRTAQAAVRPAALPLHPAHLDWGVKNARFEGGRVCTVYDWDSLCAASEAEMVGRAAAQFTAQWQFERPRVPTPAEARDFVAEYEQARGRRFDPTERRVVGASAVYLLAQVARLELAAGPAGERAFVDALRGWDEAFAR